MSDIKDPRNIFVNQRQEYSETAESHSASRDTDNTAKTASYGDDYASKVEEMKRLAAKYEREGEGQLVKDIVANVIEQKARGNLTNEQLIAFANRVTPLLNAEQRSRLTGLLQELLKL
ncbi:MAG: hypothetical protein NC099_03175 [Corallococcus sp.]|nr:hypothetical protein [Bacillota bacterium]MCM1533636.1 hypothetical protein [Corallococcus sp.]